MLRAWVCSKGRAGYFPESLHLRLRERTGPCDPRSRAKSPSVTNPHGMAPSAAGPCSAHRSKPRRSGVSTPINQLSWRRELSADTRRSGKPTWCSPTAARPTSVRSSPEDADRWSSFISRLSTADDLLPLLHRASPARAGRAGALHQRRLRGPGGVRRPARRRDRRCRAVRPDTGHAGRRGGLRRRRPAPAAGAWARSCSSIWRRPPASAVCTGSRPRCSPRTPG